MLDDYTKEIMLKASNEIKALRHQKDILQAKVDTMELFSCFLFAKVPEVRPQSCSEDLAWRLENIVHNAIHDAELVKDVKKAANKSRKRKVK